MWQTIFFVSDPKYLEKLLPAHLKKGQLYKYGEPVVGEGLITGPLETWKRHRKTILPTFNQKILDDFVEIFTEQSNMLVKHLREHSGKEEFDVFHTISKYTLDAILETAMGVKVNTQTTNPHWADRLLEIMFLRMFVFYYQYDFIFNRTTLAKDFAFHRENMHTLNKKIIREKKKEFEKKMEQLKHNENIYLEEEPKRKVFLDYLIEHSKFTEQELLDEVNTFVIAGSDTTASTNSFAFLMLGMHQDMQQKVYEEVIEVIGPTRPVESADLPHLKYLERIVKESLRLFPATGIIIRSIDKDVDLGDHVIPAGSSVLFGILRVHTNEEYWPDPYKFDPDRFLPEEVAKRHPCAYIPFSYGPRNCIGGKYAMMFTMTLLATVIRKYKIFTSYKCVEDIKIKANLVLRPKDGYNVSIELR